MLIDILYKEQRKQKVITERAGCSQSGVLKHIHGKLPGSEICHGKRCMSKTDDQRLKKHVKQNQFKNLGELHKSSSTKWAATVNSYQTMSRNIVTSFVPGLRRKRTGTFLGGQKSF